MSKTTKPPSPAQIILELAGILFFSLFLPSHFRERFFLLPMNGHPWRDPGKLIEFLYERSMMEVTREGFNLPPFCARSPSSRFFIVTLFFSLLPPTQ